jgi:hypothetical protein
MNELGAGVVYSLWLRSRWLMAGLLLYFVILATAVQLSPMPMQVAAFGIMPPAAAIAHLLTVLTLGPADLGARGSGFPRHMLVLPLRTRTLAGWPMLIGVTTIALLWMLATTVVLWPGGLDVPLFWPAALGAASTAWLQAIGWSPFPSPFVRVPALAIAITPLILLGGWAGLFLESSVVPAVIVIACLVWIVAAYFVAVRGLSLTRSGSEGEWLEALFLRAWAGLRSSRRSGEIERPPFRSASAAQLWYELRRNGRVLGTMYSFIALPMLLIILMANTGKEARSGVTFGTIHISTAMLGLMFLVSMFLLLSGMYGLAMGKFDVWGKEQMSPFFAVRPVSTARFAYLKMKSAIYSSLATWMILLVMFLVWAITEASPLNPNESVVLATLRQLQFRDAAVFVSIACGLLVISCRSLVVGMWPGLLGNKWIANATGFVIVGVIILVSTVYLHQEYLPQLLRCVPWLIGGLLIAKFAATAWCLAELNRRQLVTARSKWIGLGIWAAACLVLAAVVSCFEHLTPMLIAAIVLAVPLTRIVFAPLALHWNRHR